MTCIRLVLMLANDLSLVPVRNGYEVASVSGTCSHPSRVRVSVTYMNIVSRPYLVMVRAGTEGRAAAALLETIGSGSRPRLLPQSIMPALLRSQMRR